jgi:sulfoxide reductase heme-binding subunit YedZ
MRERNILWLKIVVHVAALSPLATLIWAFWRRELGPDPVGEMTWRTGRYALTFLILSLTPTVIATVTGFKAVLRIRRALGLYAFMYAALHFLVFVGLDYGFDFGLIVIAIVEGPFVLVGLAALIILTLLAVTSTAGWSRRLGQNWKRLHRLVYLASGLAVVHYAWRFKELRRMPLLAGAVLLLLLMARIPLISRLLARWRSL